MIKITEKPILETATEDTYIIGHDAEGVKRIPASAVGGSGGSGGGIFLINHTCALFMGSCTNDKTYSEILEAFNNGMFPVIFSSNSIIYYLTSIDIYGNTDMVFSSFDQDTIIIDKDNNITCSASGSAG